MTNSIQRTNPLDLPIPHPTVGRLTLLSHRKIGSCDQPGRFNQAGCLGAPCHSSAQVQRVLLLHPRRAQLHGLRGLGGRVVVPPEVLGVRRSPSGLSLRVVLGVRRPSGFAWISSGCLLHWAFASALPSWALCTCSHAGPLGLRFLSPRPGSAIPGDFFGARKNEVEMLPLEWIGGAR